MAAQIALQRLYALLHPHHRHRAIGARHHAAFAPNTAALIYAPDRIFSADSALGADVGAGRIFTLAAQRRRRKFIILYHADPRCKARSGYARTILILLMGHHAGDFTGTAADALCASAIINRFILAPLGIKMQSARKSRFRALILNGVSGVFSQMPGTIRSSALAFPHGKAQFARNRLCRLAQRFE